MRNPLLNPLLVAFLLFSTPAWSADPFDRDAMQSSLRNIMASPDTLAAASQAGEERGSFCTFCHGRTGISAKDWIPNLASQSGEYILDQNIAYATGERDHKLMNELAASMSADELINMSVFYAAQAHRNRST